MQTQADLVRKYQAGALQRELAELFGVNRKTVMAIVARHGATRPKGLDGAQAAQAVERYGRGESLSRIAADFSVNPTTVRNVLIRHGVTPRPRPGSR